MLASLKRILQIDRYLAEAVLRHVRVVGPVGAVKTVPGKCLHGPWRRREPVPLPGSDFRSGLRLPALLDAEDEDAAFVGKGVRAIPVHFLEPVVKRSEERRVGKECRSRW